MLEKLLNFLQHHNYFLSLAFLEIFKGIVINRTHCVHLYILFSLYVHIVYNIYIDMALEEELFEENTSRRYKRFLSFFLISSGTVAVRTRGKGLRGFTSITEIRRGTYNGGPLARQRVEEEGGGCARWTESGNAAILSPFENKNLERCYASPFFPSSSSPFFLVFN